MNHAARFETALRASNPGPALRELAIALGAEGLTRQKVYDVFEEFLISYRKQKHHSEAQEDLILDTMDALSGSCHPDAQLLTGRNDG